MTTTCLAKYDADEDVTYACTRERGHAGAHVADDGASGVEWPADTPPTLETDLQGTYAWFAGEGTVRVLLAKIERLEERVAELEQQSRPLAANEHRVARNMRAGRDGLSPAARRAFDELLLVALARFDAGRGAWVQAIDDAIDATD